jgi:hypothetical protein
MTDPSLLTFASGVVHRWLKLRRSHDGMTGHEKNRYGGKL